MFFILVLITGVAKVLLRFYGVDRYDQGSNLSNTELYEVWTSIIYSLKLASTQEVPVHYVEKKTTSIRNKKTNGMEGKREYQS